MFLRNFLPGHMTKLRCGPPSFGIQKQIQHLEQSFTSEIKAEQISRFSSQHGTKGTASLLRKSGIQDRMVCEQRFEVFMVPAVKYSDAPAFREKDFRSRGQRNRIADMHEKRSIIKQRLESGVIKVPEMRTITSLPDVPTITGNESFVGMTCDSFDMNTSLLFIAASTGQEDFLRVVNPGTKLHPVKALSSGLFYDPETNKVIKDGETVETVTEEQALNAFIDFLKKQSHPTLITYKGKTNHLLLLYQAGRKYGLFEQIRSLAPVHLDAFTMAQKVVPKDAVSNHRLDTLCRTLIQEEVNDVTSRARGTSLLFSKYLMQRGYQAFCASSDYHHAQDTYLDMVANYEMNDILWNKLSRNGIGLDHLMYLKKQGHSIFEKSLLERNIRIDDIEHLFKVL